MYLGSFENLRKMLNEEFGPNVYTDDNNVVDGKTSETIAQLTVIRPDLMIITFQGDRSPKFVTVISCLP
jgi:hypothetical protein